MDAYLHDHDHNTHRYVLSLTLTLSLPPPPHAVRRTTNPRLSHANRRIHT